MHDYISASWWFKNRISWCWNDSADTCKAWQKWSLSIQCVQLSRVICRRNSVPGHITDSPKTRQSTAVRACEVDLLSLDGQWVSDSPGWGWSGDVVQAVPVAGSLTHYNAGTTAAHKFRATESHRLGLKKVNQPLNVKALKVISLVKFV